MKRIERRDFLRLTVFTAAAGGAGSLLHCFSDAGTGPGPARAAFPQGVASGDPRESSVVLWTRVEAEDAGPQLVTFELARDEGFRQLVAHGQVTAEAADDFTIRVKVTELEPYTRYFYRFRCAGAVSDTGRTLTAPAAGVDVPVKLAVAYGQSYVGRSFNAYKVLLEQDPDIDFVLFLGDYVYEADVIRGAQDPTPERHIEFEDGLPLGDDPADGVVAYTLRDYRLLYRTWRSDPHLRRAHQLFPFITIWDDHEFANDSWQDHANDFDGARGEEKETARREAATRAFHEYLPLDVDYTPDAGFPDDIRLYRSFRFGRHLELFISDQRYYRDDHVIPEGPKDPEVGKTGENTIMGSRIMVIKDAFDRREAERRPTLLGAAQRDWLVQGIQASDASFKVLGNPVIMAQMLLDLSGIDSVPQPLRKVFYFKVDQWDGFRSERAELLSALSEVQDLVVLTGDIHACFASELHVDFDVPGPVPVSVEYIGPSISSVSLQEQLALAIQSDPLLSLLGLEELVEQADAVFQDGNPHYRYVDSGAYGYAVAEVDRDREVRVTMVQVRDVITPDGAGPVERVRFRTRSGTKQIERL